MSFTQVKTDIGKVTVPTMTQQSRTEKCCDWKFDYNTELVTWEIWGKKDSKWHTLSLFSVLFCFSFSVTSLKRDILAAQQNIKLHRLNLQLHANTAVKVGDTKFQAQPKQDIIYGYSIFV